MYNQKIIDEIKNGVDYDEKRLRGYSIEEIKKIEKLYKINVNGDFYRFLNEMGRCDGGLIGKYIVLYYDFLNVRGHIDMQMRFFYLMQDDKNYEYLNNPFVFSIISETQYYFIQTKNQDDTVYHYDENTGCVDTTNKSFIEFMKYMVKEYGFSKEKIIRSGEMIII